VCVCVWHNCNFERGNMVDDETWSLRLSNGFVKFLFAVEESGNIVHVTNLNCLS